MKRESVVGFMFASGTSDVLLIEKLKPVWMAGKLNGIGGTVREGEAPFEAMCLKFMEDTGRKTSAVDWRMFCTIEGIDYIVYFFKSDVMTEEEIIASFDENSVGEALTLGLCIAMSNTIVPDLRWLIPLALDKDIEGCVDVKHKDSLIRSRNEEEGS